MLLEGLTIEGLRYAEHLEMSDLEALVVLPFGPAGVAVLDGLSLWCAALNVDVCHSMLPLLGLQLAPADVSDPDSESLIQENGLPVQVVLSDSVSARQLLADGEPRRVTITGHVLLDPPMYGTLREHSTRSPMLIAALGQHPRVTIKVGWLFNRDMTVASVTVHHVHIGDTEFPLHDAEGWLYTLLQTVGRRCARLAATRGEGEIGAWVAAYRLSASVEDRRRFDALTMRLAQRPFELPKLDLVAHGESMYPVFTDQLCRARQLGIGALDVLEFVGLCVLERPDVLLADGSAIGFPDEPGLRLWMTELLAQDGAPVEQVFWMGGPS